MNLPNKNIKCSMCGKDFSLDDYQENFCFDRIIGYGSKYDETHIKFNLCCNCFDKTIDIIKPLFKDTIMEDWQ